MLNKIMKILNAVSQVILIIIALLSLFTAYIVFAPDQLPKPFHLMYVDPGYTPGALLRRLPRLHDAYT